MSKGSIIITAEFPILNPKAVAAYPNLSANYSVYLNTLLYSNWLEIFSEINKQFEISTLLSRADKEYIPKYFLPDESHTIFYNSTQINNVHEHFVTKSTITNSKVLILFYNSIGMIPADFLRVFDLIQTDEPTMVIGKSARNKIVFICSAGIDKDLLDSLITSGRMYDEYLNLISGKDIFIHTLDNFLSIDDFEDIKKLYIELSKKESLSYCNQKMHEGFNDLFIEYKELLNV